MEKLPLSQHVILAPLILTSLVMITVWKIFGELSDFKKMYFFKLTCTNLCTKLIELCIAWTATVTYHN